MGCKFKLLLRIALKKFKIRFNSLLDDFRGAVHNLINTMREGFYFGDALGHHLLTDVSTIKVLCKGGRGVDFIKFGHRA